MADATWSYAMAVGQDAIPPVPWQKKTCGTNPPDSLPQVWPAWMPSEASHSRLIQSGNMTCMSLVFLSRFEFLDQSILHIARHEFVVCEVHDK